MNIVIGYFLRGLLFVVPIAVTLYVVVQLFQFIDGLLARVVNPYLPNYVVGTGLGLVVLILVITLLGIITSSVIAQQVQLLIGKALERVPLIKTIYSAIKDLLSAFVGKEKRFEQPVLVKLGHNLEIERVGFLTKSSLADIGLDSDKVAVYLPHAYAWSGNLVIVPRNLVTPLNIKPAEAMKLIISGGVTHIVQRRPDGK
ncbi:DUF502 domain-containing protein [Geopsychrobacter electrodiphilus]|uniref:DUF502 domain-containing protein n=1 Tax=Geopsychrobacter electrodiphilus TaxID=225196 RepID=UPI0003660F97|nr:DUF502 domain-containing protein [Geopsychrobacter electrodiphilus]